MTDSFKLAKNIDAKFSWYKDKVGVEDNSLRCPLSHAHAKVH